MRPGVVSAILRRASISAACLALARAGASAAEPAPADQPTTSLPELVITGTRIPRSNLNSVSPITQISGDQMKDEGLLRVEDAINRLPQAFADQTSTVTNGATGTATANLRDLGPERTLVLIDGKRLLPGDPTAGSVAPDLNFVPSALVDRIDVVTGGASAVYGSDAVAGVVNFIMKRDFTGVVIDAETGAFNHANDETGLQTVLAAQGIPLPGREVTDGYASQVTIAAGANAPDGRGNVTVYGAYRQAAAVTEATRDFSACQLAATGPSLFCMGSFASPATGLFAPIDAITSNTVSFLTLDPTGPGNTLRPFDPARDGFNPAPFAYLQRPDRRWTAGLFAHYQAVPDVELYADGMLMYDDTREQLAPSGLFFTIPFSISCTNPMLSAAEVQAFCTDANVPPGANALVFIGHRNVNAGGRQYRLTHEDYRVVAGARGAVGDWRYDLSVQYASVAIDQTDLHDVSLARAADALDVTGVGGTLVCASGNPGCAPYDVFQIGGVTQAALNYIDTPAHAGGGTTEAVISANLTGKLGRYGVKSPWADEGAGVAVGAEWRRESLDYAPDAELASGDLASATASPAVSGRFSVFEIYGEAQVPLAQRRGPLLQDLSVEGGYRYSWYTNVGQAQTYKAGLDWAVAGGVRLRSSFNHAVRAPNVVELFTPRSLNVSGLGHDPCAGADPVVDEMDPFATQANCARTGVSAGQYGAIAISPAGYNALQGGNPELRPEAADTWTLGLVFAPTEVPGFDLTIDYFDIRVTGVIETIDPDTEIEQCLQTGNPFLCSQIHRAPGSGSLWIGADGFVTSLFENAASLSTRGLDFEMHYRRPLPTVGGQQLGAADLAFVGTYLMTLTTVTEPGALPYDCAGFYGINCGDPVPHWRHVARIRWETPWNIDLSLGWRYFSSVIVAAASPNPLLNTAFGPADFRLAARSYVDLSLDWRVSKRVDLRVGVNNVFDVDPPIVGSDFRQGVAANANTYPGVYDALGRWVFVGLTAHM